MKARHSGETHQNRHAEFTGTLVRISKMISSGNETAPVVGGICMSLAAPDAELELGWCRRLGEGGTGDCRGVIMLVVSGR